MSSINIRKKICVDPSLLDQNVLNHILGIVQKNMAEICTKEYGYILSVNKINQVHDFRISAATGKCVMDIEIDVTTIKPEMNSKFTGKVCLFSSVGIFVDIQDKFQVLIPMSRAVSFVMNDNNTVITNGDKKFRVGNMVNIQITAVDYDQNNKFSSCGDLLE